MEPMTFIAGALSLLAVPGPTNSLLATAGAAYGLRKGAPLLAAELGGYLIAILTMRAALGPLIASAPALGIGLRLGVVVYLLYLAAKLWRHGARARNGKSPVTFVQVLVTTLLNPKALIFAFTLLPQGVNMAGLFPWLMALALQIVTIGFGWICLGATAGQGLKGRIHAKYGYRISAIALAIFAGMIARLA